MRKILPCLVILALCTNAAYADMYKVNDWTIRNIRARTLTSPYAQGHLKVSAECRMENWKGDYGFIVSAGASRDANVYIEVKKRRGYLDILNSDGWSDLRLSAPSDVNVILDANEYPALFTRDTAGDYQVLAPFYPHSAEKLSADGSVGDYVRNLHRKDSERNIEVIEFMADARIMSYKSPKSGKQLAQFYIKGTQEAFAIFRRCMQNGGEL